MTLLLKMPPQTPQSHIPFHLRGDTDHKQGQRTVVVEHLTRGLKNSRMRLLSLPGEGWLVEKRCLARRKTDRIVGCEINEVTFNRSVPNMLLRGSKKTRNARFMDRLHFSDGSTAIVVASTGSIAVNCNIVNLLAGNPHGEVCNFSSLRESFNAYWLDFFGPIGSATSCSAIRHMVERAADEEARFAFAFLIGRDAPMYARIIEACPGESPLERRASFLHLIAAQQGREVRIDSTYRHRSYNTDGNAHMGTVMGTILPRKGALS